jgi:hypothetical protein
LQGLQCRRGTPQRYLRDHPPPLGCDCTSTSRTFKRVFRPHIFSPFSSITIGLSNMGKSRNLHRHVLAARVIRPASAHPASPLSKDQSLIDSPTPSRRYFSQLFISPESLCQKAKTSCRKCGPATCRVAQKESILVIRTSLPRVLKSLTFFTRISHSASIFSIVLPSVFLNRAVVKCRLAVKCRDAISSSL